MRFITDCISAKGPDISAMTETAIDITRRTFLKHVNREDLDLLAVGMGYQRHPQQGLTMAADYSVSYHRSKYQSRRCYYFCWSAIEYVFV